MKDKELMGMVIWNIILTIVVLVLLLLYGTAISKSETCECKMPSKDGYTVDLLCVRYLPDSDKCAYGIYTFLEDNFYKEVVENGKNDLDSN